MIKPLNDNVLLTKLEEAKVSTGGIHLVSTTEDKLAVAKGLVVSCGNGKYNANGQVISMNVKINDVVLYDYYAGHEVKIDDQKFFIVPESKIHCVLEK